MFPSIQDILEMPKVYTLSGNHGEYESNKWNGIIDNNNSTISVDWLLSLSGSDKTFNFSGDMTGTYQNYRLTSPNNIDSNYEATNNLLKAELTYWATTDYGGTKYTSYFYYKKKDKKYTYRLYVIVNNVVKIGTNIQGGGYGCGSTIQILVQGKQVGTTIWYSMSSWELKENINIYFSITNARFNGNSIAGVNGNFRIHSGYPNSNQDDYKSTNYKNQLNPTITSFDSWDSSPAVGNPSTVSVDIDGTTQTIDVVCDSSSKSGSTSGGGLQPGEGFQPIY